MATCMLFFSFVFTIFISMILQAVGFFSPYWVSWKECDAQGLFYFVRSNVTDGCYDPGSYVSKSALVLEAVSFVIHFLVCLTVISLICCTDCDGGSTSGCFGFCLLLFPVAGILSLVGCTKISNIDIPDFTYGSSYNLCLASGIYTMILVSLACYACCCSGSDDDGGSVNHPETTVATTPSSGRVLSTVATSEHVGVAVSEHQEVHVSNGMVFVRKMRVMNVVRFMR